MKNAYDLHKKLKKGAKKSSSMIFAQFMNWKIKL
jgi:hypothetical protein